MIDKILEQARAFMETHKKATWQDYNNFKNLATDFGNSWLDNYDEFIDRLLDILKI